MVILNRIYTRTGDDGTTGLASGERVRKNALRVEAYGAVDEANSALGVAVTALNKVEPLHTVMTRMQNDLFDLGADLATPDRGKVLEWETLRITPRQVERLEAEIDRFNQDLAPLNSFILPGGSMVAAYIHLARAIMRRAERNMVALMAEPGELVSAPALQYANRASDLLFVLARWANDQGRADILWVPGQNRQ